MLTGYVKMANMMNTKQAKYQHVSIVTVIMLAC